MRRREFLALAPFLRDGHAGYTIVGSAQAAPTERRAARELQHFLLEMTGAEAPLATDREPVSGPMILVGPSEALDRLKVAVPWKELGSEGFLLKTVEPHLIIAGGGPRGTLYGVYAFLERLGCRWYTPEFSRIPKRATLGLPRLDVVERPLMEYREVFSTAERDRDWAARNRTNGHFSALDDSTGGKVTFYPFGHSFETLVPPSRYFSTHPEYFSFTAGERRVERAQLCLTNPDVIRLGIEGVLKWAAGRPDTDILSVTQNDTEGWCECPRCARVDEDEGSRAGTMLRFVNAIAAEVAKRYPGRYLDTFAYSYTEKPPLKTRPAPNLGIRLAPIGLCQAHPYEKCARNASFVERLKGWAMIAPRLYVWHYFTNFWHHQLPYPNLDELKADIAMYHRAGVRGMFLQGDVSAGGPTEFSELKSYLLAKLLWNPYADAEAIEAEFLRAFYGPSAPAVKEYLELEHREVRLPPAGKGKTMWTYKSPWLEKDFYARAHGIFDKALKASQDAVITRRVEKARMPVEWAETLEAKRMTLRGDRWEPADPSGFARKLAAAMKQFRSFGYERVSEADNLDGMEREYAKYARSFPVAAIANDRLRAVVVPEYQARIISLVDLHTGREVLRQPGPEERSSNIEGMGGIVLLAHAGYVSPERYTAEWEVLPGGSPNALELRGVTPNGLEIRNRLELRNGEAALRTRAVATNRGAAPVRLMLQARSEFQPGPIDSPTVEFSFRRQSGGEHRETLLPQGQQFFGIESFLGNDRPDREWRLHNPALGITLANRFHFEQAHICRLWWRGRGENKVNLCLWSAERSLQPGESLALDSDYLVECE